MSVLRALREHPVITATMIGCTVLGIVVTVIVLPAEWPLLRRVLAGVVAGAGSGFLITAPRMYGGW